MKKLSAWILFAVFSTSVLSAAQKRPEWVISIPVAPHLYQGIGVADNSGSAEEDRLRADQNARTEIIQEISSTISSAVSSYYQESIDNMGATSADNMEVYTSLSSSFADATIEGIQIVDRFYDKKTKTYYSYATLSRAEFQEQMKRKAAEATQYARTRFDLGHQALNEGDVRSALNELSGALNHVLTAQSIVNRQLEGDINGDGKTEFLDATLGKVLTSILNRVSFIKIAGDNQKGERDQALSRDLTGQLIYESGDVHIPVSNAALSVQISGAEAKFPEVITTDSEGKFSFRIDKIISATSPKPTVGVNFHLPQMTMYSASTGINLQDIMPAGLTYSFSIDVAASVKIFVRVLEEMNGERNSKSQTDGLLIRALIAKKYKVIDAVRISRDVSIDDLDFALYYEDYDSIVESLLPHANYAIIGVISSETSSTGTINYAQASAKLNVIDLNTGRIVSSGNRTGPTESGNTELQANQKALKKCSYSAIADIIAGLQTALN